MVLGGRAYNERFARILLSQYRKPRIESFPYVKHQAGAACCTETQCTKK